MGEEWIVADGLFDFGLVVEDVFGGPQGEFRIYDLGFMIWINS